MHNIGWTAALRAIDRSQVDAPNQFSRSLVAELAGGDRLEMARAAGATTWRVDMDTPDGRQT